MNSNRLPDPIDPLFTLGEDMSDGCHAHEVVVNIKQNKEADIRADLVAAIIAQGNFKAAQTAKTGLSAAVTVADSNAKAYIGEHCLDIVDDCVQITGGIGVTWEHDIHLYNRRAAVDRAVLGTPEEHKARLVALLEEDEK